MSWIRQTNQRLSRLRYVPYRGFCYGGFIACHPHLFGIYRNCPSQKKNTVFIHCARLIAKYALRMDAWNINPVLSRSWPKFSSRLSRHSWYTRREGQQLQREEQLTFGWRWLMPYNQVWFSAGNQVEAWKPPTGLHEPGWTIWTKGNAYNPFTEIANCSLGEYSFSVIWIIQYESYQLSSHVRILGRRLMRSILKDTWMPFLCFSGTGSPILFDMIWYDFKLRKWRTTRWSTKKDLWSIHAECRLVESYFNQTASISICCRYVTESTKLKWCWCKRVIRPISFPLYLPPICLPKKVRNPWSKDAPKWIDQLWCTKWDSLLRKWLEDGFL